MENFCNDGRGLRPRCQDIVDHIHPPHFFLKQTPRVSRHNIWPRPNSLCGFPPGPPLRSGSSEEEHGPAPSKFQGRHPQPRRALKDGYAPFPRTPQTTCAGETSLIPAVNYETRSCDWQNGLVARSSSGTCCCPAQPSRSTISTLDTLIEISDLPSDLPDAVAGSEHYLLPCPPRREGTYSGLHPKHGGHSAQLTHWPCYATRFGIGRSNSVDRFFASIKVPVAEINRAAPVQCVQRPVEVGGGVPAASRLSSPSFTSLTGTSVGNLMLTYGNSVYGRKLR